jgi:hypothetical protein
MIASLQSQFGAQGPATPIRVAWVASQNSSARHYHAAGGKTKAFVEIGVQNRQCFFTRL